ncbi:LysR family transcriptional regulator [Roseobacter sp. HKCCD9010]|uniref:LysR substrate-binding domain-containing protein n=1 Tax=unclassified Roseobacter TaxID=196798 RepID=UPI001490D779|nr:MULTISPECIES: LysR substrate-binding domain-containing protein [unclassified Roseobacter]MBF9050081.1 LysR family transcriptional regulator [Rhodobacterales bacterium HKCCD4356]NNV12324.1 LysR family transcriptional regulator [Roseobacter sp. HKCCD7357]NNV16213.1 LysR family transcriptional regulator [Roseobacter sp. HKCCD8768]NNV25673.1 LysR family transcriptional regulator [Roseobacter sp. HKCCD8192]NNV29929.1 LysR family transcriptional regulator [Roseobacter sp. HKCCD9061]
MDHKPYLTHIRSFEAAARHLSFTAAADELNYTQAAISNHVRSLEEYLGKPLFIRHARSLELTGPGQAYLPGLRRALQQIEDATEAIVTRTHDQTVVISCPISLAENWLAAQVAAFLADHSSYTITLNGTIWADSVGEVADLTIEIKRQDAVLPGDALLASEELTVVSAPGYQVAGEALSRPEQLVSADLIHILTRQDCWGAVADGLGLDNLDLQGGVRSNSSNVALELAANGLGCVAVLRSLAQPYLDRNVLIEPFPCAVESPWSYYLTRPARALKPSARRFRDWLLERSAAEP